MKARRRMLRGIKGPRKDGFAMRKMRLRVAISSEFFGAGRLGVAAARAWRSAAPQC
jgi:hypothetical protein